ncbi:MAG: bifunctional phosphopantothenoylcysteine decarboxylase/phosphopantothenate--cysteine ligase CoaBC [Flavobacteriaceae bacterium]|nr:bifunctional phosphopantothenoylcysteine decarboxylase/phosphopantothenate--cysteine ligase CoaBC [Flavobacteriaceae bacterium]
MLQGKRILLGVSGSIAAYKTPLLVRLLVNAGAEVQVILSESAKDFVTPLTLSTVSNRPVFSAFVKNDTGEWANHVELGLWADLVLIAPTSANTLAKLAHGLCDNLLMATCLSARCAVAISPAMDLDMYAHKATQTNFEKLEKLGYKIIPAANGELASGMSGIGRMPEPDELFTYIQKHFEADAPLSGKKALVTAGPTYEAIDPVRFIGNYSSGKMGIAVAESLARKGAEVTLIHGPIAGIPIPKHIKTIAVTSSNEMLDACLKHWPESNIAVMAAAVADYRPVAVSTEKIKKTAAEMNIALIKSTDILAEMGKCKKPGQMLVGFALETENELENARKKLEKKNLDLVVLNSLRDTGAGFGYDTNRVTLLAHNTTEETALKPKTEIADDIVEKIIQLLA